MHISEIISQRLVKKGGARCEWQTFISYFQDNLRDSKDRKYSPAYVSMRLSHLKNDYAAIYLLQKRCEKAENFSKAFFGSLKVK